MSQKNRTSMLMFIYRTFVIFSMLACRVVERECEKKL